MSVYHACETVNKSPPTLLCSLLKWNGKMWASSSRGIFFTLIQLTSSVPFFYVILETIGQQIYRNQLYCIKLYIWSPTCFITQIWRKSPSAIQNVWQTIRPMLSYSWFGKKKLFINRSASSAARSINQIILS